jgi:predicted chitinase
VKTNPKPAPIPVKTNPKPAPIPVKTNPKPAPIPVKTNPKPAPIPVKTNPKPAPIPVKTNPKPAPIPVKTNPKPAPIPVKTNPKPAPIPVKTNPKPAPTPVKTNPKPAPIPVKTNPKPAPIPVKTNPKPAPIPVKTNPKPAPTPVKTNPKPAPIPVKTNPKPAPTPVKTNPETQPKPVQGIIKMDEFTKAVKSTYKKSNPTAEQLNTVMASYQKHGGITDKRELAMFLAQTIKESAGLKDVVEGCSKTKAGCPQRYNKGGVPGQQYYGRGYIQLTHAYNYKKASEAIFGDDRLLKNPDLVKNEDVAWQVSFWFWKNNVHNNKALQEGHFDASTTLVNGAKSVTRDERFEIYKKVYKALGIPGEPIK